MSALPQDLIEAMEHGELTVDQLRALITIEAAQLDLTFEQAVKLADRDELPATALGADVKFLVGMLPPVAV